MRQPEAVSKSALDVLVTNSFSNADLYLRLYRVLSLVRSVSFSSDLYFLSSYGVFPPERGQTVRYAVVSPENDYAFAQDVYTC